MRVLFWSILSLLGWMTVFTGAPAGAAELPSSTAYIFTSFHDADQKYLRFLCSFDGYHWTNVPGTFLEANVGMSKQFRDPSILRGPDGTFHLVWTAGWHGDQGFGYADSKDLIHWSEQKFIPVMTNEPTTVNVWAPELFYDQKGKQFVILWASTIPGCFPDKLEKHDNNQRLYFTTTRDFQNFTPEKLFFEPGYSAIDGFILKDGKQFVLVNKDNSRTNLNLRVAFAKSPLGPWKSVSEPFTQKFTEGPCALKIGDDWLIYFDAYREKIFGAAKTRDFKTFADVTKEVSFPPEHKHGTAIAVPRKILDNLLTADPR
ncbi:MAG TPA: glycoside hydrolase family 43 protein [Verrucomicrobiae bacterium]|nr:glycoside hydrolase family 43 protein [Verrucomicrobiae bacterium]